MDGPRPVGAHQLGCADQADLSVRWTDAGLMRCVLRAAGLARIPNGIRGQDPSVVFGQYERHAVWDKPGGLANRSGAGDLDVMRRWCSGTRPEPSLWPMPIALARMISPSLPWAFPSRH